MIARRFFSALVVVFCVFTLSFLIMRSAPGSPFDADKALPAAVVANQAVVTGMAEPISSAHTGKVSEVRVEKSDSVKAGQVLWVLEVYGELVSVNADEDFEVFRVVAKPGERLVAGQAALYRKTGFWRQYVTSLLSYARFDFGTTFDSQGQRTVLENIKETLPVSAELGCYALFIALLLGVTAGMFAGWKHNTIMDHTVMSFSMLGISVPSIVLGPLLIFVFIIWLQWLPPHGGWESGLWTGWGQKILPSLTLGLAYAGVFARLTRGGMLDVVRQDFIRTARAKGLSDGTIIWRHAFRGAIVPTVTFLGPAVAHLLVGSVVVETVFNVPGISKYFVESALNRDYPMVMGVVVLYSTLLVFFNFLVDLAYAFLDPRVSLD
jgi:oligopeptide transport system permease protein